MRGGAVAWAVREGLAPAWRRPRMQPSETGQPDWSRIAPTAPSALVRLRAEHLARNVPGQLARNVPLSASTEYNPALTRTGLLGRFLETWERIFVLCYRDSCPVHSPAGAADGRRMWWPELQDRISVFDAADLDRQNIEVVRWAGCDLPNRSAGRSGDPATQDPCVFTRRAGGADWRRTSKHRLLALLAHLTLVDIAAKRNLSSVLILEADAVQSLAVEELSRDPELAFRVARRMGRAFATQAWSVARLSGMFYSKEFAPAAPGSLHGRRHRRLCSRKCSCQRWDGSSSVDSIASLPRMCMVPAAPSPADRIMPMLEALHTWCDVRDTAAYAVHRSAFATFSAYLKRLRSLPSWLQNNAIDLPAIDNWLPHTFPCIYILPTLVTQPSFANDSQGATGLMRQTSARNFLRYCGPRAPVLQAEPPKHRPMKLSSFATRHLYVIKGDEGGAEAERPVQRPTPERGAAATIAQGRGAKKKAGGPAVGMRKRTRKRAQQP